ncbi:hypothetical protein LTR09_003409 [Extremus antarcticus]|uniref:Aromatic amino acid beta-eliminating lyase/threonine aldolase domain-containing protein n=1 Tax=Extremus antarcticus TaxID=702011 RepID=A0AAJ0GAD2_9PEZI|nr:hypothetical protein LTR09_003409 [Extremus antarcticus]
MKKPLSLSQFATDLTPQQEFERTASYTKDPTAYLQKILGSETFDKRKVLLCLPEKIDKDIYGGGEHKAHFQQHVAKLLGKDHGLFFITGVQAQLAAMEVHCDRAGNNRVAWHITSHLESFEENAYDVLYGLERRLLGNDENENPTVEEIKEVLSLSEDQRPAAMVLEIPSRELGCKTYSFADLEAISSACREAGVKLHCDGARIWEIEPYYQETAGKTFADIGKLFDTVYVSFYKGLRGPAGAMLVCNDDSFISEAKKWQRRAGGTAFTLFYEVIDCERGYNENIGTFDAKWKKMTEIVDAIIPATASYKSRNGNPIISFLPEKPTCCQIRTIFQGYTADELVSARDRVVEKSNVMVFDRLWPKKPLDDDERRQSREWMVVQALLETETKVFVDAYVALCEELVAGGR